MTWAAVAHGVVLGLFQGTEEHAEEWHEDFYKNTQLVSLFPERPPEPGDLVLLGGAEGEGHTKAYLY